MKVKHKSYYGDQEESVENYVTNQLQGYLGGVIELTQHNAETAQAAVARLCGVLVDKGIMLEADLLHVVDSDLPIQFIRD